jgi:hypothetical protein
MLTRSAVDVPDLSGQCVRDKKINHSSKRSEVLSHVEGHAHLFFAAVKVQQRGRRLRIYSANFAVAVFVDAAVTDD